jgi:hypothetical protein
MAFCFLAPEIILKRLFQLYSEEAAAPAFLLIVLSFVVLLSCKACLLHEHLTKMQKKFFLPNTTMPSNRHPRQDLHRSYNLMHHLQGR